MKQHDFIQDSETNGDDGVVIAHAKKRKLDLIAMLVCLLFAFVMWIYFVNINDDNVTAEIKVKLDVVGSETLKNETGQMVYGLDTQEVTIVVKGTNRDIKKFSSSDYKVTVDVSSISGSGKHILDVQPSLPAADTGVKLSIESILPQNVIIYSDVVVTESIDFEVINTGLKIEDGYVLGNITKNTDKIQITGPKALIHSISEGGKAQLRLSEASALSQSREYTDFKLDFCDKNGEYMPYDDTVITYSTSDIKVVVPVYPKKEVDLLVYCDGENATDKYDIKINSKPVYMIEIAGEKQNLLSFGGNVRITITASDFVNGVCEVTLDNSDLSSENIFFVQNGGITEQITVTISKKNSGS